MAISGQKTVPTAGTAVALGTRQIAGSLAIKALPTNVGIVFVGNDGAGNVTTANGYPLAAGESVFVDQLGSLGDVMVNSTVNGEGVAWLALGG
jgi:hypothetical protein